MSLKFWKSVILYHVQIYILDNFGSAKKTRALISVIVKPNHEFVFGVCISCSWMN
jgi:hypothetical protein